MTGSAHAIPVDCLSRPRAIQQSDAFIDGTLAMLHRQKMVS